MCMKEGITRNKAFMNKWAKEAINKERNNFMLETFL